MRARAVKFVVTGLREDRLRAGVSQAEFARRMGWSPAYQLRVERGEAVVTREQLGRISALTRSLGHAIVRTA